MIRRAYRLCAQAHAETAYSGEGARRFGGRWNSPGSAVAYAAESLSLAQLEILVRTDHAALLRHFACIVAEFPAELARPIEDLFALPADWDCQPPSPATQQFGDRWVKSAVSAVLSVPSVVSAGERNWMFNPRHPDFPRVRISPSVPFRFDLRLVQSSG